LPADGLPLAVVAPPEIPVPGAVSIPSGTLALLDPAGEVRSLEEIEGDAIRFAISHYCGQMSEVARRLRIGRSTLYRKLDSLGLAADRAEPERDTLYSAEPTTKYQS
jgi:Bacterial regulatory protein, Fis family